MFITVYTMEQPNTHQLHYSTLSSASDAFEVCVG